MPIEITMPRLSDTMESGTVIKWNVKEGDAVSAGDVIADVETDKATMEMPVYDDGVIASLEVKEGQKVSVGTVIAVLKGESEATGPADKPAADSKSATATGGKAAAASARRDGAEAERSPAAVMAEDDRAQPKPASAPSAGRSQAAPPPKSIDQPSRPEQGHEDRPLEKDHRPSRDNGRIFVSPMARRLAEEHRIDIRNVEGSGPGGRIIKRDVLAAVESAQETAASVPPSAKAAPVRAAPAVEEQQTLPARAARPERAASPAQPLVPVLSAQGGGLESQIIPLSNMRQTIAKRLVESKSTIPHYQVSGTFNMDSLIGLRSTLNTQLEPMGVKLSVNDFLVRACALAIHQHPHFNAAWGEDHLEILSDINVGIAISLPIERGGGLVVATIRNADVKGLRQISLESKALAEKARTRGLTIQEMSDSTFTISNLGMYGVESFNAIINPPNVAILAVGAAVEKPVVRNHQLVVGHEMTATISCDHRVIDGAMAAEYLATLRQMIENPGTLLV